MMTQNKEQIKVACLLKNCQRVRVVILVWSQCSMARKYLPRKKQTQVVYGRTRCLTTLLSWFIIIVANHPNSLGLRLVYFELNVFEWWKGIKTLSAKLN